MPKVKTRKLDPALERLARRHGIQTSYLDNVGHRQFASEETLRLILERLGVGEGGRGGGGFRMIEPVAVRWEKERTQISVRLPARDISRAVLRLTLEDGSEECIPLKELPGVRTDETSMLAELRLDVPEMPMGYHTLSVEAGDLLQDCLFICAPKRIYSERQRQWGGFMPLYAAHSAESWGAGNLTDWRELCGWMGGLGAGVMGTLPLMAAFLEHPVCEPSPYSPASRLFWNEFFIDVTAVPEFQRSKRVQELAGSALFRRKLANFRASVWIDYKAQWALRRSVLEIMAREFFSKPNERYGQFRAFLAARPEVEEYAQFRGACDSKKRSWHVWEARARAGNLTSADFSGEAKKFYLYIQWIAQEQMDGVLASCGAAGVKFYLDLPLGVNPDGFDAWRFREFFAPRVNAGAPPDSFFTKGQDWGFAPFHPQRTRDLKYKYVIDYLRFQMRHTGLLRIDHVMGLHRLWWVPHGHPASDGAYVNYPAEEFYAILSVESHRHKTTLVGENLGTVPPEVNKCLTRHGVRRMYVSQYEQQSRGGLAVPEHAVVASINTHDMPSFAAHWKDLDIADRVDLGLIPKAQITAEKRHRQSLRRNVIAALRRKKFLRVERPTIEQVLDATLRYLAKSPAETVLVTLEDLWNEERPQNVPGTSVERPNWRRKAIRTIEELRADQALAARLREVSAR